MSIGKDEDAKKGHAADGPNQVSVEVDEVTIKNEGGYTFIVNMLDGRDARVATLSQPSDAMPILFPVSAPRTRTRDAGPLRLENGSGIGVSHKTKLLSGRNLQSNLI